MDDQAKQLRELLQRSQAFARSTRLIAVTSGKGGVGKSNFTLNFALGLIEKGQKVVIFDVDLGLANLDVLMGISPKKHLLHLLEPQHSVWDIIEKGPNGLEFIAGGSGFTQLQNLDEQKLQILFDRLAELQGYADTILFDTGAGISRESLGFMLASDEILLVTTPEPTSITDAYAVIKMIHSQPKHPPIRLVINRATSVQEGKNTAEKLFTVSKRFLNMELGTLGYLPDDSFVSKAVKQQKPFLLSYPHSQAAKGIKELVNGYLGKAASPELPGGLRGFISKMRGFIK
ncbi:MinD/ParA family protein [Brevibacillus fulvus]|uniref:Flagellar biosynthesis protein FlhG n=1 Tax=Brevibacillus fulvus TaxID=1125967 RepID=A0A938XZV3_9BACL|nr:MinD/ParA family protein [Brevibacillus fulvus]MBM7590608.1 flagellar biosynthesis protein FlhG [Brevibacillus fulvus]